MAPNNKAFVDTTVLADALLKKGAVGDAARNSLQSFAETQLPVYAIKELKAGPLAYYVWLHNKFASENSYANVLSALHSISRTPKRNLVSTALEAMAGLAKALGGNKSFDDLQKRHGGSMAHDQWQSDSCRIALKAIVLKAWRNRRKVTNKVVGPLTCYLEGKVIEHRSLLETGPRKCTLEQHCCLHVAFVKKLDDVEKLRDVCKQGTRDEDRRRYQVLREIARKPNRPIDDGMCRNLGDAVFAFFCPPDAVVLTTNLKDHAPLAQALGKTAQRP